VRVEAADPGSPEARRLIAELDEYSEALYPPESNHLVPVEELQRPNIVFLLAWLGAQAVGCGALVDHAGGYGELKRIYVQPASRRGGVARAILSELFNQARSRGLRVLRLETGNAQPEALALYERAGFRRRAPFGDYREDPLSFFMELELD
jgi:putative acetyltransferase